MSNANLVEWVSAIGAVLSSAFAFWAAYESRKSSEAAKKSLELNAIDLEYNIAFKLRSISQKLWNEYNKFNDDSAYKDAELKFTELLEHIEWCCIITDSRSSDLSKPLKHLEDETLLPLMEQLKDYEGSGASIANKIKEQMITPNAYQALMSRLKYHGFNFVNIYK